MAPERPSQEAAEVAVSRSLPLLDIQVKGSGASSPLVLHEFSAGSFAASPRGKESSRDSSRLCTDSLSQDKEEETRRSKMCTAAVQLAQMERVADLLQAGIVHEVSSPPSDTTEQLQQSSDSDSEEDLVPLEETVLATTDPFFRAAEHRCYLAVPLSPTSVKKQFSDDEDEEVREGCCRRWECRVVTPCVGIGVDFLSCDGCGVVVCGHPFPLFCGCCAGDNPADFASDASSGGSRRQHHSPLLSIRESVVPSRRASPTRTPVTHQDYRPKTLLPEFSDAFIGPLSVFVATWNTEYQEFATEYISSLEAELLAKGRSFGKPQTTFVEWSDGMHHGEIEASQSSGSTLNFSGELELDSRQSSDESDATTKSETQPFLQRTTTLRLEKPGPTSQPLKEWLLPGYDIYVITLQEVTNDHIFDTVSLYLDVEHGERYLRVDMGEGKISGLGKGAWTKMKATSMACWIRESVRSPMGPVTPLAYNSFSFTKINGSKGAVTLVLQILKQNVCFVGCHMPASGVKDRCRARHFIRRKLAHIYSDTPDADFALVFHHVIWAGDFNFRLQTSLEVCLPLLEKQDLDGLLQYDECREDQSHDLRYMREAPLYFLPTYKKADNRPPLDTSDPDWMLKEYQVKMKKRVLAQKKTVERPPSWCDRVLFWSMPEIADKLQPIPGTYFAATPKETNVLMASDHAPVGCGLNLYAVDGEVPRCLFGVRRLKPK